MVSSVNVFHFLLSLIVLHAPLHLGTAPIAVNATGVFMKTRQPHNAKVIVFFRTISDFSLIFLNIKQFSFISSIILTTNTQNPACVFPCAECTDEQNCTKCVGEGSVTHRLGANMNCECQEGYTSIGDLVC